MTNNLNQGITMLNQFSDIIKRADLNGTALPAALRMSERGAFETYYAPFEFVNTEAKVVICGITPGQKQAWIALRMAQSMLNAGKGTETVLAAAKGSASFAGQMRTNMARMFDHVGLNAQLGVGSCIELFSKDSTGAHFMSALRYPTLKNGKDYSGGSEMVKNEHLWRQCRNYMAEDIAQLPQDAVYVPLGKSVDVVFARLVSEGVIESAQVLSGFPHPSGLNAERIAYFCQQKPRETLSRTTNPAVWDERRTGIIDRVHSMRFTG